MQVTNVVKGRDLTCRVLYLLTELVSTVTNTVRERKKIYLLNISPTLFCRTFLMLKRFLAGLQMRSRPIGTKQRQMSLDIATDHMQQGQRTNTTTRTSFSGDVRNKERMSHMNNFLPIIRIYLDRN